MTDDFHFDTEIIIKLHHQGFRIAEVPIPTYYGNEICYVNGMRYARDVVRAVRRYKQTTRAIHRIPNSRSTSSTIRSSRPAIPATGATPDIGTPTTCWTSAAATVFSRRNCARRAIACGAWMLFPRPNPEAFAEYQRPTSSSRRILSDRQFDVVLLLDVLEHLRDPERILRRARRALTGGRVIVSLPNVANVTVRLTLLFGRFEYTERGILDRTHLRFFTRRSALRMLRDAGFTVEHREMTVIPLELIVGSPEANPSDPVRALDAHRVHASHADAVRLSDLRDLPMKRAAAGLCCWSSRSIGSC